MLCTKRPLPTHLPVLGNPYTPWVIRLFTLYPNPNETFEVNVLGIWLNIFKT